MSSLGRDRLHCGLIHVLEADKESEYSDRIAVGTYSSLPLCNWRGCQDEPSVSLGPEEVNFTQLIPTLPDYRRDDR